MNSIIYTRFVCSGVRTCENGMYVLLLDIGAGQWGSEKNKTKRIDTSRNRLNDDFQ